MRREMFLEYEVKETFAFDLLLGKESMVPGQRRSEETIEKHRVERKAKVNEDL